ncbi:LPS export ABC transporter ATP-binding protein [Paracoccaceae bacterium]|jgi:lipopolysaccharide export system ATP-binding protein|nr:LPS export ABC transporter ATP-binding protein [Paracoccaceae bacterium]|tara:strand:+ start:771 stop:1517 length:747 start_codon:yes stop_codon:yes gene_type:complete
MSESKDDTVGLHVKNLGKKYRNKRVITDISLSLYKGEVVALLGPNGAGKTTTFYGIAGLVIPEEGTVLLNGKDVTFLPMYRRAKLGMGYLPQEASIFRGLSVQDNILSILELWEPSKSNQKQRLDALLQEFSISHLRTSSALSLSGGERRRVEIARCLASEPEYVLLDEPFAGIDPVAVGEIRDIVSALKNRGIGVLITDHNVRETLKIVDRAYILNEGRLLKSGTPDEVIQDENVRRVYLGEDFQVS